MNKQDLETRIEIAATLHIAFPEQIGFVMELNRFQALYKVEFGKYYFFEKPKGAAEVVNVYGGGLCIPPQRTEIRR